MNYEPGQVLRLEIPAGDDRLHIPFRVDISTMNEGELDRCLDAAQNHLGASYSRDRDLFLAALDEHLQSTNGPGNFPGGPYLRVSMRLIGNLGISAFIKPMEGDTVYTADQFLGLAEHVTEEVVDTALEASEPARHKPQRPYASDWERISESGLQYSREIDRYWDGKRVYDRRSALHNGLVGPGATLRDTIRGHNPEPDEEEPSP